ncbi:hypothetical protein EUTSA_v10006398mg [Eutrema salsugineum]|uniref:F-box domain-containing protein n=1 Tax=Eutrema salsugineum TaxID=72664 RepID=V4LNY6_EUTSA|nr:hypothetical protein EUTSA_v10006398mg [Eutrema salsugineum]
MDLFSSLPDDLLCHILSFLTTKEAALTSVLSKRWRHLFAFGKREKEGILGSFMDFVDRVLALQGDSPIEKFSLKCKTVVDSDRVDGWICNALQRGVSKLDLFIDFQNMYWLRQEVSVSRTLVELKVGRGFDLHWWPENTCCLPKLKTLVLDSTVLRCGQFRMLLLGCPALEVLDMTKILWMDTNVTVSSPILKKLTIDLHGYINVASLKSLSLDAPSLVYFYYCDALAEDYPQVNLKNVVEAQIHLLVTQGQIEQARALNNDLLEGDVFPGIGNVRKLVSGIKNVQELYLSPDTLEVLSRCCEAMPVFNNLKLLAIYSDMDRGWQAMPGLLRNCPHLETLIIEGLLHYVTDKCGDACDCIYRDCIPQEDRGRSLRSCPVKKLEIYEFGGTIRELEMIRHFLKYFRCLKEMKIYAEEDSPTLFKDPEIVERVGKMMYLYNRLYTCNVQFLASEVDCTVKSSL